MIDLPNATAPCRILEMPSARLGSDKYKSLSHWFDSTTVLTHEVQIPPSSRTGGGCSTHSTIPSGGVGVRFEVFMLTSNIIIMASLFLFVLHYSNSISVLS